MTPIPELKERFSRDPLPLRWGGVASDLLRLSSLARAGKIGSRAFQDVLTETKFFTEWLAKDVGPAAQEEILSLQRVLSAWMETGQAPTTIEQDARQWSERILGQSGLV